MRKHLLKKVLSVALSLTLIGSAAAILPAALPESGIKASAATYGDYKYEVKDNEVTITGYNGSGIIVTIPSAINGKKVTSIGDWAFEHCTRLISITIPDSVTSIGEYAFYGCPSPSSITIPSGVTSIGGWAFSCCTSLTSITIPDSVTSINDGTFYVCTSLTSITIPSGVTSIGDSAFSDCTSLTSITIPDSVTSIGEYAFSGCTSLTSITIPSGVTSIGDWAFEGCTRLTSITIPDSVTSIGDWAFGFCTRLKTIYGKTGSYAEKFAKYNGYTFIDKDNQTVAVTGIKLDKTKCTIEKGKTLTLTATITPTNATNKNITWTSSNTNVATVANGKITAKSAGTATITAKTSNGKTAACKVTVKNPAVLAAGIKLDKTSTTLGKGETITLNATITPTNTTNKAVTWTTSNSSVATVSGGKITAKNNGTATITAKTSNGKTAACKITVKSAPSKITLTKGVLTIGVGEKYSLGSNVNDGAGCATRTYRTSNSSVVKMTKTNWTGEFVGVKPGVAYVTVRTYNGKEHSCKVTVKAAPKSVTISKKALTMKVGQTETLSCWTNDGSGCAKRTFRTSNSSIVKMTNTNWTGSFKAVKAGTAWVTVRTYNGKESSCKVTVTK